MEFSYSIQAMITPFWEILNLNLMNFHGDRRFYLVALVLFLLYEIRAIITDGIVFAFIIGRRKIIIVVVVIAVIKIIIIVIDVGKFIIASNPIFSCCLLFSVAFGY